MSLSMFKDSQLPGYQFDTADDLTDQQLLKYDATSRSIVGTSSLSTWQTNVFQLTFTQTGGSGVFAPTNVDVAQFQLTDGKYLTNLFIHDAASTADLTAAASDDNHMFQATLPGFPTGSFGLPQTTGAIGTAYMDTAGAGIFLSRIVAVINSNTITVSGVTTDVGPSTLKGFSVTYVSD